MSLKIETYGKCVSVRMVFFSDDVEMINIASPRVGNLQFATVVLL